MTSPYEKAVFGGGCFWCTEAVFKMFKGVISVTSGYAGGTKENPTYEEISNGNTGHAEVVQIEYNPSKIAFEDLLTIFFGSHDPTTRNQQGNDVGTQYRSVILYTTPEQRALAERFIADLNASNAAGKPIVTEVAPLEHFYPAESYHQDYYENNKNNRYCEIIINPKLEKVQKQFAELLKNR
jgi:peptide-methionine (S)-S-oxide reductase